MGEAGAEMIEGLRVALSNGGAGPGPDGQPRDRRAAERRALAALAAQAHRFCEGCQARVEPREERRHCGLWLWEACMKTAWAKKKALAHLLGQRFLDAGLGGDPLLWNRNVTLAPVPLGKAPASGDGG